MNAPSASRRRAWTEMRALSFPKEAPKLSQATAARPSAAMATDGAVWDPLGKVLAVCWGAAAVMPAETSSSALK